MILASNVLTCALVLLYVCEPTLVSCIVMSAGFHLSFTSTYAPLLVKTNRTYRIFSSARKSAGRPPLVSSKAQVMIVTCITSIQVHQDAFSRYGHFLSVFCSAAMPAVFVCIVTAVTVREWRRSKVARKWVSRRSADQILLIELSPTLSKEQVHTLI